MKTLPFIAAALVLPALALAQERTAGQSTGAQVNWSVLRNQIDLVSSQNKALAATISKLQACNAKEMLYAPAKSGADANGCVNARVLRWVAMHKGGRGHPSCIRDAGEVCTEAGKICGTEVTVTEFGHNGFTRSSFGYLRCE